MGQRGKIAHVVSLSVGTRLGKKAYPADRASMGAPRTDSKYLCIPITLAPAGP